MKDSKDTKEKKESRKDAKNQLRVLREVVEDATLSAANSIDDVISVKDVKLQIKCENEVYIDVYIIVRFGSKIPDVAWCVQTKVRESVEKLTHMTVKNVNINIQGVKLGKENDTNGRC